MLGVLLITICVVYVHCSGYNKLAVLVSCRICSYLCIAFCLFYTSLEVTGRDCQTCVKFPFL